MPATHAAGNYYIGATATTYGEIQSYTENETVETDEALDSNGDVFAVATRNEKIEASMEIVTTGTLPSAGTTLALVSNSAAGYILVQSVNLTESNTDHRKATISGVAYLANSLPAAP